MDSGPSLEQLVEAELFDRDLGSTGFVTVKELQAALQEAGKVRNLKVQCDSTMSHSTVHS